MGLESTLGPTNRTVQLPATLQSLRKNQHREDDIRKFSFVGYAENCNPDVATVKSSNGCRKSPHGYEKIIEVLDGCQKSFNVQEKFSGGFQKSTNGSLKPSKVSESRLHACRSRRCGVNYSDWASRNLRSQPRKFRVAKRIQNPNQEGIVCKCCKKKSNLGLLL
ncbi:hypothetical protein SUGI_0205070 [Cryptomeria japonica]|nr:hypothetical protein SUGI_0205070 [Cryptomeria japonica]